jgi:uncharacterized cupin superfamily protein
VADPDFAITTLDRAGGERFQRLRDPLGARSLGINLLVLQPGDRGRIHAHEHQEEAYLVLEGELTLVIEGFEYAVDADQIARVGAKTRRQLVNKGPAKLVLFAFGAAGEHVGRDGCAWASWDDDGPGAPPEDVPV